jgi:hypothetical protein
MEVVKPMPSSMSCTQMHKHDARITYIHAWLLWEVMAASSLIIYAGLFMGLAVATIFLVIFSLTTAVLSLRLLEGLEPGRVLAAALSIWFAAIWGSGLIATARTVLDEVREDLRG